MSFFSLCEVCAKRKFYVSKRVFKSGNVGTMKSQSKMCGSCARVIRQYLTK